jgi:hypothetical protein
LRWYHDYVKDGKVMQKTWMVSLEGIGLARGMGFARSKAI